MSNKQENYFKKLNESLANPQQQTTININVNNYKEAKSEAETQFSNLELARKRAANIRQKTTEYLDTYLINFEAELVKRNIKVIWASDAEEANQEIYEIVKNKGARTIVKSSSSTLNEINVVNYLAEEQIKVLETAVGDYLSKAIKQLSFHPVFPILNKNTEDINQSLNKNFSDLHQAASFIETEINNSKQTESVFLSGATFLLADIGGIVLTENEGNILKNMANYQTHIIVCGIDKMLANVTDLDSMLPLLSTYASGQFNATYHTVLTNESNHPITGKKSEIIVILLDNGRSELLLNVDVRRAASCIKCGACLINDPLFTYNSQAQQGLYKGVIGNIINQHYDDETQNAYESFVAPLSASLMEQCPVAIDFDKMLLYNRRDNVSKRLVSRGDSIAMFFYKGAVLKRASMEKGGSKLKNFMLRQFFKKQWGQARSFPSVAPQSFNELWREKN
ncbi:MAG: lactate utilization protein [Bacteroidia bacterium]|nr:lactate utilization protein [Bacteroidia bacterium]